MTNRELLVDFGYENLIVFENPDYDAASIGVSSDDRVVYDYDKMIACLMDEDGMDADEAADFISYNTIRAIPYAGQGAPIVMFGLDNTLIECIDGEQHLHAEWIICPDGYYPYCSHCGEEPVERKMTETCHNCGAYMKQRS